MFSVPQPLDFAKEEPIFTGLRELKHSRFERLVSPIETLLQEVTPGLRKKRRYAMLEATLLAFLTTVEFRLANRARIHLCIREAQRAFLELEALFMWDNLQRLAKMTGLEPAMFYAHANLMGALTFDRKVARMLYLADIPVWFVQPASEFHRKISPTRLRTSNFTNPIPGRPPVFEGPENSSKKYLAFKEHTRSVMEDTV